MQVSGKDARKQGCKTYARCPLQTTRSPSAQAKSIRNPRVDLRRHRRSQKDFQPPRSSPLDWRLETELGVVTEKNLTRSLSTKSQTEGESRPSTEKSIRHWYRRRLTWTSNLSSCGTAHESLEKTRITTGPNRAAFLLLTTSFSPSPRLLQMLLEATELVYSQSEMHHIWIPASIQYNSLALHAMAPPSRTNLENARSTPHRHSHAPSKERNSR